MTQTSLAGARYGIAATFVEALAAQDFDQLAATLAEDACLHALVPAGVRDCQGPDQIRATFASWFGNTADFELVEAVVGAVGSRLYLRWRIRLRANRLGAGWFVVEQHVYADTTDQGPITQLRLLCSGYCAEHGG
jgi:limonene-1,2-epoxide hydrolase